MRVVYRRSRRADRVTFLILGAWFAFVGAVIALSQGSAASIGFGAVLAAGGATLAVRGLRVSVECDPELGRVRVRNLVLSVDIPLQTVTNVRTRIYPSLSNLITRRRALVIDYGGGLRITARATEGMSSEDLQTLVACITGDRSIQIDLQPDSSTPP